MIFNYLNKEDRKKGSDYNFKLLESKSIVEIRKINKSRSSLQNRALHKFFSIISNQLNEIGQEFGHLDFKDDLVYTKHTGIIIKEFIWRPIQKAMFNIESTKDINTNQINDITDVLIKYYGEMGLSISFPSIQNLMFEMDKNK